MLRMWYYWTGNGNSTEKMDDILLQYVSPGSGIMEKLNSVFSNLLYVRCSPNLYCRCPTWTVQPVLGLHNVHLFPYLNFLYSQKNPTVICK